MSNLMSFMVFSNRKLMNQRCKIGFQHFLYLAAIFRNVSVSKHNERKPFLSHKRVFFSEVIFTILPVDENVKRKY